MNLPDRLKQRRQEKDLTQEEVAARSSMNVTQYNGYERGRSAPAMSTLKRIAEALEVDLAYFGELETNSPETEKGHAIENLKAQFRSRVARELGLDDGEVNIRIEIL